MKNCAIGKYGMGGHADEKILEAYVNQGPEFLKWTRDTHGYEWQVHFHGIMQDYTDVEGFRKIGRSLDLKPEDCFEKITGTTYTAPANPLALAGGSTWVCVQASCDKAGVEIMLETEGYKLYQDEAGAVVGLLARDKKGNDFNIRAHKIILGTGGFDHNADMRNAYLRLPLFNTSQVETNTGDGQMMGYEIGAALDNMTSYYGAPSYLPEGPVEGLLEGKIANEIVIEASMRSMPGAVAVNKKGRRVGNECAPYGNFNRVFENYDSDTFELINVPLYVIADSTYVQHYAFPLETEVGKIPDWVVQAETLEELAGKMEIDVAGLTEEMAKFNANAANGIDPDFHRGEHAHDMQSVKLFAGNRTDLPNPVLAPVATGPFYCAKLWPGSCGTSGGLRVNENAQVLSIAGEAIPGLYATGCCSAGIGGPTYFGGGVPVGSGSVRAWVAGSHKA